MQLPTSQIMLSHCRSPTQHRTWTSPTKRTINLTQLQQNKRACKQRPGRKRPRLGDCDVVAAPDADSDNNSVGDDVVTECDAPAVPANHHHLVQLSSEDYDDASTRAASMSASTKVVVASCTVTQQDLMTLDGDTWINNAVMHSYLSLLSRGAESTQAGEIYVLPSFLAVRWQSKQYSTVE